MDFPLSLTAPIGNECPRFLYEPSCTTALQKCVPRSYRNKQSSSCSGHCPFCCLFLINFISVFHWTCLSFCLYFLFFSCVLFVSTQGYETFCFLSIKQHKTKEIQRKAEIMQLYYADIIFGHVFWEITQNFLCIT